VSFVAFMMLIGDRLKYLGLVAGLAFATLLITQQASILMGMATQTSSWIRDTGAGDLWVMDPQQQFSEDGKTVSDTALYRVRGIDGVEWAVPIYKGWLKARLADGTQLTVIVCGIDDATLVGGPPQMVVGEMEDLRKDRAVFVEHKDLIGKLALTRRLGADGKPAAINIGDRFSINDYEVVIAGTMKMSPSFFWDPVVYTTYSRALTMAPKERKLLGQIVTKVRAGHDVHEVQARIEAATGLKALTTKEFERATERYILEKTGILINFALAVGLGLVIGLLVAAQTLYAFTLDNLKHFGVLKAMGATNGMILRMQLFQVLIVALLGYGLGLGVAVIMGRIIVKTDLAFLMTWHIPVAGGVALLAICMIAGALSVLKVFRLEPAVVFKS
jgi:putative ABC transport system permease protein